MTRRPLNPDDEEGLDGDRVVVKEARRNYPRIFQIRQGSQAEARPALRRTTATSGGEAAKYKGGSVKRSSNGRSMLASGLDSLADAAYGVAVARRRKSKDSCSPSGFSTSRAVSKNMADESPPAENLNPE
ncbi:hypothetical protein CFC21_067426 [Triticum aestivum]|uniref:DUF4005 domain-containing protein n=2 Tax=Triticum aestivum TaxID=4565 RepID=A0A9R1H7N4_WHEAT|nr:hypothetical protein CFC21_067426 [Triticum aestivum]